MKMKKYAVEIHVMASDENEALNRAASAVAMGLVPHAVRELLGAPVQQELDLDSAVNKAFHGEGDMHPEEGDLLGAVPTTPKKKITARRYEDKEVSWIYDMVVAGKSDKQIGKSTGRTSDAIHHVTRLLSCDDAGFAKLRKRYSPKLVAAATNLRKNRTVNK